MTSSVHTLQLTHNTIILTCSDDMDVKQVDEDYGAQLREAGFTVVTLPEQITVQHVETQETRKVFYVDVGNMPASKIKPYLQEMSKTFNERGEKDILIPVRG